MAKKGGLGSGLGALFRDDEAVAPQSTATTKLFNAEYGKSTLNSFHPASHVCVVEL